MRTILAGSRALTDPVLLETAISESGIKIALVFSGRARGVDSLGEGWARKNGIPALAGSRWSQRKNQLCLHP
jgi:hypothetical protein